MTSAENLLRLGELDAPSIFDNLFQLGELIARTNAAGGLVRPGFFYQVKMTLPMGRWDFTLAEQVVPEAFVPAQAASQFAGLEAEMLPTILSGYAHLAYQVLEPVQPGFVGALLAQLLPEARLQVPQPRPALFAIERVLLAYGATFTPHNQDAPLALAAPAPPATAVTDDELLLTTLVVFVGKLNLTPWLAHIAACEPKRALPKLLAAFAQDEFYSSADEWGGVLAQLWRWIKPPRRAQLAGQSALAGVVLRVLGDVYSGPGRLAEVYEKEAIFKVVRTALDQLPAAAKVRATLLASLMDGLDSLASRADAQGAPVASIQLAQSSMMALQLLPCPAEPAQAEAWLSQVQAQIRSYSWDQLSPDQPLLDKKLVLNYGAHACSVRLAMESFCNAAGEWYKQGKTSNQFWSANWFGLERLRQTLRLFYALSQQEPLPQGAAASHSAAFNLNYYIGHYQQAQVVLAATLGRNLQPGREMSVWVQCMLNEDTKTLHDSQPGYDIQRCRAVKTELQTHGYSPQALQRLGELVAELGPGASPGTAPAKPVAEELTAAYWDEEDEVYRQVLSELLRKDHLHNIAQLKYEDGRPCIPPPPGQPTPAEREVYYEDWLIQNPGSYPPEEVLNLAPSLRSMAECMDEYRFLLDSQSEAVQALAAQAGMAALATRDFEPVPAPDAWQYTVYRRYTPFHQYPDPVGSWGMQLGLHLSRVCFNAARDTGFFFVDLDRNQYIMGSVAQVRKEQGRWVLQ